MLTLKIKKENRPYLPFWIPASAVMTVAEALN
jgi:hypothetical protein